MSVADAARELAQGNELRRAGRLDEAAAAYRRAVALAPSNGDAHYNLAIALRQAGDLRSAAIEFRAAARANPRDMDAVQNVIETLALAVERGERPFVPARREPPRLPRLSRSSSAVSIPRGSTRCRRASAPRSALASTSSS